MNAKNEVRELIRSFIEEAGGDEQLSGSGLIAGSGSSAGDVIGPGSEQVVPAARGDDSDEECWANLPAIDSRTQHMLSIPSKPVRGLPGKTVRSRMVAINGSCEASRDG